MRFYLSNKPRNLENVSHLSVANLENVSHFSHILEDAISRAMPGQHEKDTPILKYNNFLFWRQIQILRINFY